MYSCGKPTVNTKMGNAWPGIYSILEKGVGGAGKAACNAGQKKSQKIFEILTVLTKFVSLI
jgi:hypothetical protein